MPKKNITGIISDAWNKSVQNGEASKAIRSEKTEQINNIMDDSRKVVLDHIQKNDKGYYLPDFDFRHATKDGSALKSQRLMEVKFLSPSEDDISRQIKLRKSTKSPYSNITDEEYLDLRRPERFARRGDATIKKGISGLNLIGLNTELQQAKDSREAAEKKEAEASAQGSVRQEGRPLRGGRPDLTGRDAIMRGELDQLIGSGAPYTAIEDAIKRQRANTPQPTIRDLPGLDHLTKEQRRRVANALKTPEGLGVGVGANTVMGSGTKGGPGDVGQFTPAMPALTTPAPVPQQQAPVPQQQAPVTPAPVPQQQAPEEPRTMEGPEADAARAAQEKSSHDEWVAKERKQAALDTVRGTLDHVRKDKKVDISGMSKSVLQMLGLAEASSTKKKLIERVKPFKLDFSDEPNILDIDINPSDGTDTEETDEPVSGTNPLMDNLRKKAKEAMKKKAAEEKRKAAEEAEKQRQRDAGVPEELVGSPSAEGAEGDYVPVKLDDRELTPGEQERRSKEFKRWDTEQGQGDLSDEEVQNNIGDTINPDTNSPAKPGDSWELPSGGRHTINPDGTSTITGKDRQEDIDSAMQSIEDRVASGELDPNTPEYDKAVREAKEEADKKAKEAREQASKEQYGLPPDASKEELQQCRKARFMEKKLEELLDKQNRLEGRLGYYKNLAGSRKEAIRDRGERGARKVENQLHNINYEVEKMRGKIEASKCKETPTDTPADTNARGNGESNGAGQDTVRDYEGSPAEDQGIPEDPTDRSIIDPTQTDHVGSFIEKSGKNIQELLGLPADALISLAGSIFGREFTDTEKESIRIASSPLYGLNKVIGMGIDAAMGGSEIEKPTQQERGAALAGRDRDTKQRIGRAERLTGRPPVPEGEDPFLNKEYTAWFNDSLSSAQMEDEMAYQGARGFGSEASLPRQGSPRGSARPTQGVERAGELEGRPTVSVDEDPFTNTEYREWYKTLTPQQKKDEMKYQGTQGYGQFARDISSVDPTNVDPNTPPSSVSQPPLPPPVNTVENYNPLNKYGLNSFKATGPIR